MIKRIRVAQTFAAVTAAFIRRPITATILLGLIASPLVQTPAAAQTTVSATRLRAIKGVRQTLATSTNVVGWVNLPGATATFTIPAASRDVFIARFTAESVCSGAVGWCPVRILLNGVEMDPVVGTDFAFDSTDGGTASTASWESHSVERSRIVPTGSAPLNAVLQVQYAVTAPGITFRLDDWHFTVQQLY